MLEITDVLIEFLLYLLVFMVQFMIFQFYNGKKAVRISEEIIFQILIFFPDY
jgi:hypothetical protein